MHPLGDGARLDPVGFRQDDAEFLAAEPGERRVSLTDMLAHHDGDEAQHLILVHALDCDDPPALAQQIKQRYEAPLRRIFEGVNA